MTQNDTNKKTCVEEQNKDKALGTFHNVVIKRSLIPMCDETLGKDKRQN